VLGLFGFVLAKKSRTTASRLARFGFSLLTGGSGSNLYDRYRRGYVVDYFTFKKIPRIVFNLGDLAIFTGSALLAAEYLAKEK